jgi:hypothetical protein
MKLNEISIGMSVYHIIGCTGIVKKINNQNIKDPECTNITVCWVDGSTCDAFIRNLEKYKK